MRWFRSILKRAKPAEGKRWGGARGHDRLPADLQSSEGGDCPGRVRGDALVAEVLNLGIVIIGMIAYVFDLLRRWLEQTLVPWKGKRNPPRRNHDDDHGIEALACRTDDGMARCMSVGG
ncbi:MAG: hypothetical protein OET79_04185 [Nitrospirota bacterium]|nr:hypothetical protein [Nitrospirota bacterium]